MHRVQLTGGASAQACRTGKLHDGPASRHAPGALGSADSTSRIGGAPFNLRSLDLNLLTVFEAIYEVGTVSGAVIALRSASQLPARPGASKGCMQGRSLRPDPQGLSPTAVAREINPEIKRALNALRATLAEASGFDPGTSQRRFRISIRPPSRGCGCCPQCRADIRYCFSTTGPRGKPS
jgi:hypothetical protein